MYPALLDSDASAIELLIPLMPSSDKLVNEGLLYRGRKVGIKNEQIHYTSRFGHCCALDINIYFSSVF